jgi:hypothetical protein
MESAIAARSDGPATSSTVVRKREADGERATGIGHMADDRGTRARSEGRRHL